MSVYFVSLEAKIYVVSFHNGNVICILCDSDWNWSFCSAISNDVSEKIFYVVYPKLSSMSAHCFECSLKFSVKAVHFVEGTGTSRARPVLIARSALVYWYFCNYGPYFLLKVKIMYFIRFLLPDFKLYQGINFVFVASKVVEFILSFGRCQVICTLCSSTNCVVNAARQSGYHGHTCYKVAFLLYILFSGPQQEIGDTGCKVVFCRLYAVIQIFII
jgi:hypothetical protein